MYYNHAWMNDLALRLSKVTQYDVKVEAGTILCANEREDGASYLTAIQGISKEEEWSLVVSDGASNEVAGFVVMLKEHNIDHLILRFSSLLEVMKAGEWDKVRKMLKPHGTNRTIANWNIEDDMMWLADVIAMPFYQVCFDGDYVPGVKFTRHNNDRWGKPGFKFCPGNPVDGLCRIMVYDMYGNDVNGADVAWPYQTCDASALMTVALSVISLMDSDVGDFYAY